MSRSDSSEVFEVLIVDDDKIVALLHKNSLKSSLLATSPVMCENGKEALDHLFKNDAPNRNFLVLLDLNMPVLDGWEFLKKLKKHTLQAKVHVIVVTSSLNTKDRIKAGSYERVIHFCRKPLSVECIQNIRELQPLRKFFLSSREKAEKP